MNMPFWDRVAFWLEGFKVLRPLLLRYDGQTPTGGDRYINKLNGHVVVFGAGSRREVDL